MRIRKSGVSFCLEVISVTIFVVLSGCQSLPDFPDRAVKMERLDDGRELLSFDTTGDSQVDYQQVWDADGRVCELRYIADGEQTGLTVELATVERSDVPHYVIALDGVPFELVEQLYERGSFRLFGRPSRVVSCFPGMTDVAYAQVFGTEQPLAYEAEYFDRATNRIVPGNDVYLSGVNADWANELAYRCSFFLDAIAYIAPSVVFSTELRGLNKVFNQTDSGRAVAYMVSTAALGTKGGREAMIEYLLKIDRYCQQLVYEHQGRVMITLLADHGHTMQRCYRVDFRDVLAAGGYRLTRRLEQSGDVVAISYGLVTCMAFHTNDAAGVAEVLVGDPRVSVAAWLDDNAVMVADFTGRARIEHDGSRYRYIMETGDPLRLTEILDRLRGQGLVDAEGWIDDADLFRATVDAPYPDAVKRLWEAFNGLVRYPSDLLVSLADGWCTGNGGFAVALGKFASTHGSLNYVNSMTFAMTTWGDLPETMRLEEVMPAINDLITNVGGDVE